MKTTQLNAGFTLIELVVVIVILAILAGAMIPRVSSRGASSRDARRVSDIHALRDAIDECYQDKGVYRNPTPNAAAGGWSASNDGELIPALLEKGYVRRVAADPIHDDADHDRDCSHPTAQSGCIGDRPIFVLRARAFETADFAARSQGYFKRRVRAGSSELAYVAGSGASGTK